MGKYSAKKRNGSKKQSFKKRKYNKKTGGMWPFTGETENPPKENVVEGEASVIKQETDKKPETANTETDKKPETANTETDKKSETANTETDKKPETANTETTQNTSAAQELENKFLDDLVKADSRDIVIQIINEYMGKVKVEEDE
jgi:hypothetical protein